MFLEISLIFVLLLLLWIIVTFRRWKKFIQSTLTANSTNIETARGTIEYVKRGDGPKLLLIHGGPGGYDQG
ncbi:hypothetical protein EU528_11080, partial [Candidatus Thorarchaeota archaeon]